MGFNKFGLDKQVNYIICSYLGLILLRVSIMATPTNHKGIASQYCCVSQNQPPAITEDAPIMLMIVLEPAKI